MSPFWRGFLVAAAFAVGMAIVGLLAVVAYALLSGGDGGPAAEVASITQTATASPSATAMPRATTAPPTSTPEATPEPPEESPALTEEEAWAIVANKLIAACPEAVPFVGSPRGSFDYQTRAWTFTTGSRGSDGPTSFTVYEATRMVAGNDLALALLSSQDLTCTPERYIVPWKEGDDACTHALASASRHQYDMNLYSRWWGDDAEVTQAAKSGYEWAYGLVSVACPGDWPALGEGS